MRCRPEQLARLLAEPLRPLWVISGDEPLLVQECQDAIRAAATRQGFGERERHHVDRGFDWSSWLGDSQALSLFSERKLVELRFPNKPDAGATAALAEWAARPPEDTVLVLVLPKLDASAQKAKWLTQLDEHGVLVMLAGVDAAQLPDWLQQRARQLGLRLQPDALQLLADRTEGNLLAASQTLEKLRLLHDGEDIDIDAVARLVSDSARYSVFDLADAILAGDASRTARLLLGLEREGQAESVVLWALQKDLRALTLAAEQAQQQGRRQVSPEALGQFGFWSRRQGPAQQALRRLSLTRLQRLSSGLVDVDKAIKGQSGERAWDALLRFGLAMAGRPLFSGRA